MVPNVCDMTLYSLIKGGGSGLSIVFMNVCVHISLCQKIQNYKLINKIRICSIVVKWVFLSWQTYGQMDHYAEVIGADATEQDYLKIAAYFEKNESHFKAGVFYFKASQYAKACILQCLMLCFF